MLEELRTGSAKAFTEIYQRYWQRLYVVAYKKTGSRQVAEDIVHEVFTSLWKNRRQSEIRSLYAYLSAATRYTIFREISLASRKTLLQIEPTDDASIDFRFLSQMIAEEINHLPTRCRLVFQYSRQEGLSNREIAQRLSISEKAVEKHITSALGKLRVQLRHILHFFL